MRAIDVHDHLRSIGTWVNWDHTCDGFKAGDPQREIHKIGVGWISSMRALQEAHRRGCDMFITHEPTFYAHMDDDQSVFRYENAQRKREFLRETGMVVYRCHDVWDVFPELGIVDSWAEGLGLSDPISTRKYYAVYKVDPIQAADLADKILEKVKPIGQDVVYLVGDPERVVDRLAVGTGAITNVRLMFEMDADAILATDDGMSFWRDGIWAEDMGITLLIVNHATAEIWGMQNLARYLSDVFPQIQVEFIDITYPPKAVI
jgi:putative NIF3 family GTP cyclohydrolase 1 type 2